MEFQSYWMDGRTDGWMECSCISSIEHLVVSRRWINKMTWCDFLAVESLGSILAPWFKQVWVGNNNSHDNKHNEFLQPTGQPSPSIPLDIKQTKLEMTQISLQERFYKILRFKPFVFADKMNAFWHLVRKINCSKDTHLLVFVKSWLVCWAIKNGTMYFAKKILSNIALNCTNLLHHNLTTKLNGKSQFGFSGRLAVHCQDYTSTWHIKCRCCRISRWMTKVCMHVLGI